MRRQVRPLLEADLAAYLDRQQEQIDSGAAAPSVWKSQRRSASMKRVALVLAGMTGARERCMYCEDSRGTDIEHFRPQVTFRGLIFRWPNMLWICAACNRS